MATKQCLIDGCDKKHNAKGYCDKHYSRLCKHGDPYVIKYSTRKSAKVDEYESSGMSMCHHHGSHTEWKLRNRVDAKGKPYRGLDCRLCERARTKKWNKKHPTYQIDFCRSIRGTASHLASGAQARAKKTGIPCTIDADWIVQQYESQEQRCALTGIPFDLSWVDKGERRKYGVSLDQIQPQGGYTHENTQLVIWLINNMKRDLEQTEFVTLCKFVASQAHVKA